MLAALTLLASTRTLTLTIEPNKVLNTFRPDEALGAGIDGHEMGFLEETFRPRNVVAMQQVGLKPLTYRLRTELGIEAWHWNPIGTWSDPARQEGYFVGDPVPSARIERSYGYRLPRRGNTIDQANNDGYSRLDDGDFGTFWKSNPYLDQHFTGDPNDRFPQWVVVDLGHRERVDETHIFWARPFATRYRLEYWTGNDAINSPEDGDWRPLGPLVKGTAGETDTAFAPRSLRFFRISFLASSGTSLKPSNDIRDRLGVAIREIQIGRRRGKSFHDVMRNGTTRDSQTVVYTSSTDPWHRASDLDDKVEQPGFDAVLSSGLTNGLPLLVPVSVLYDNPETAENEVRWLRARRVTLRGIEMGEEPDGQYATPEHYAVLYERLAHRLHLVAKGVPLGGPCYQTAIPDVVAWPDASGNASWTSRFVRHLKHAGEPLGFFSFEWYPWDNTLADTYPQLKAGPAILAAFLRQQRDHGLPTNVPWMITEYGYSAFSGPPEVDLPGGILNADLVGTFLATGGDVAYLYGYEPNEVIEEEPGAWGNLMLLQADADGNAKWKLPTFWTAWMMTHVWTTAGHGLHRLVTCSVSPRDADIGAYALIRPDGKKTVLLVNRNPFHPITVDVKASSGSTFYSYGPGQFLWQAAGANGRPSRSLRPRIRVLRPSEPVVLPPSSINVLVLER